MQEKAQVFLCDDDRDIVEVTRLVLEEHYHVHVYYSCDKIVEDAIRIKPAAIVLDLWMPEEGGEEITRQLKSNSLTENIPVILFSASNNLGRIASSINADAFIAKPYDIDELLEVVDRCIAASATNAR